MKRNISASEARKELNFLRHQYNIKSALKKEACKEYQNSKVSKIGNTSLLFDKIGYINLKNELKSITFWIVETKALYKKYCR